MSVAINNNSNSVERIREVWADNLAEEMSYIRSAIDDYPFVAMVNPRCPLIYRYYD